MPKKDRSLFDLDEVFPIEVPVMSRRAHTSDVRVIAVDLHVQDLIDVGELF